MRRIEYQPTTNPFSIEEILEPISNPILVERNHINFWASFAEGTEKEQLYSILVVIFVIMPFMYLTGIGIKHDCTYLAVLHANQTCIPDIHVRYLAGGISYIPTTSNPKNGGDCEYLLITTPTNWKKCDRCLSDVTVDYKEFCIIHK
jgi:hypothetical protein